MTAAAVWEKIQTWRARWSPWPEVLLIPLAANLVVWGVLYGPQKRRLESWREAQLLVEQKPRMEALLRESREVQSGWESTRFSKKDPSAVVEVIQQLAGRHGVEITHIQTQGASSKGKGAVPSKQKAAPSARAVGGFSTVAVQLEAVGNFGKLARWMSDVETQYGLQIDSWSMTAGNEAGQPSRMTLQITAFLRGN